MSNGPSANMLKQAETPREAAAPSGTQVSERLFQAALERLPSGALLFDSKQQLVLCNAAARSLLELPGHLFAHGTPMLEQLLRFIAARAETRPNAVEAQVREHLRLIAQREPHRFRLTKANGRSIEVTGTPLEFGGFLLSYVEIERATLPTQKSPESGLKTIYDTALPWPLFHKQANGLLQQARSDAVSALHFIDVNDYKGIFQRYGEQGATILVQTLVQRIGQLLSPTDKLTYLGEDEFAILQYDIAEGASLVALRKKLGALSKAPFSVGGIAVTAEFSLGTAFSPREGNDIDTLLLAARNSMRQNRSETPHAPKPAGPSKADLRQQRRMSCNVRCRFASNKGTFWGCIVDISRTGFGMTMDPTLSLVPGFRITLENGPLVGAKGTVSWATWGSCGVLFDSSASVLKQVDAFIAGLPN